MASNDGRTAAPDSFAARWWYRNAPLALVLAAITAAAPFPAQAQDDHPALEPPRFLGERSCSSSSCHGGAGTNRDQYIVWSKYDFHHSRPYATLETARAEHITATLKLGDPTRSAACTVCHAPFQAVPEAELAKGVAQNQGVSCESCHGRAERWLRGHTRRDWTHENRIHAGMRDLNDLYVRANTCVACHQTLAPSIRQAGHPELLFELDGQAVSQPRHWRIAEEKPAPQIWLVGQAVALREMSWQLAREKVADSSLTDSWAGLTWLLQLAAGADSRLPALDLDSVAPTPERLDAVQKWSNRFAQTAAGLRWPEESTRKCLALLTKSSGTFNNPAISRPILARRAERLVLALDRLVQGLGKSAADPARDRALNRLFDDVESLPDFDPKQFAKDLEQLHASASGILGSN